MTTRIRTNPRLDWDEAERESTLAMHGLDLADARLVLDSPYRLDVRVVRGSEPRIQSSAYVFDVLAVLSLPHTARGGSDSDHPFPQGQYRRTAGIP